MMRRKFTLDDFEHSLKEHADEFKMIPSKKVWHGIYNDIHPGRRWPSVSVAFLLMFTLIIVGHLNTHNELRTAKLSTKTTATDKITAVSNHEDVRVNNKEKKSLTSDITIGDKQADEKNQLFTMLSGHDRLSDTTNAVKFSSQTINPSGTISSAILKPNADNNNTNNSDKTFEKNISAKSTSSDDYKLKQKNSISNININNTSALVTDKNEIPTVTITNNSDESLLKTSIAETNVNENKFPSTLKTQKSSLHKKRNEKVTWTYFAAPVISNVILKGKPISNNNLQTNLSPTIVINASENKVLHNPALGLAAGLQLNYVISHKFKFTSGLEITYSGYRIASNEVHPTFATLTLKDRKTNADYVRSYVTHFGNGTGEALIMLRNYSLQASLPVGLQYQMFGNKKIQFNTAASIEPSVILKSNAYLLSTVGFNYVNDPALMRKWNASSNFGAFVSFSAGKLKWQVGPNVRYQLLSTYKADYSIKEHLIDYGIRIAITQ